MSGEIRTYVSVPNTELRRLREQESRLRSLRNDLPERLESIRQQVKREMDGRIAPIEARQREYAGMVRGLQSELGALERGVQKQLEQQSSDFNRRLREQRGEYLGLFEEQDRKFTKMIEDERSQRHIAINNLQGQINAIAENENERRNIARTFIVDLEKIISETGKLPHQRFAPGQMESIQRHVNDARGNVERMPPAALSTAQKAYWDIVDLRILVMQKEQEFMLIYQAALQEARLLLEEARANREYQLELGQGNDREVLALEVDHWTHGELSAYEGEVKALEKQLASGENTLTTEQVKDILAKIEALKPKITEIVERARQNIIASQLRVNIADSVVDALKVRGFVLQDATYEGDDQRNSFIVKVKNIAGSEVVTIISPIAGEAGKNEVSIHSYDETFVDEATLKQRAKEIVSILNEEGLEAEAPRCAGTAKPEYRDIVAVKQGKSLGTNAQGRMSE